MQKEYISQWLSIETSKLVDVPRVYYYAPFIAEVPKNVPGELSTQISDDAVGYVEMVDDLVEKRDSLF